MGVPHVLLRTTGCNLRCEFHSSRCDTPYTSWWQEAATISENEAITLIDAHSQIRHILLTGGEPTLQRELPRFISKLKERGKFVTVETNGTRMIDAPIDLLSISPKLSNSYPREGMLEEKIHRTNNVFEPKLLDRYDFQLKPVISKAEDLSEVDAFVKLYQISPDRVWIMPEGTSQEELAAVRKCIVAHAITRGYNYSDRLHIVIYGNRRGV